MITLLCHLYLLEATEGLAARKNRHYLWIATRRLELGWPWYISVRQLEE